MDVYVCWIDRIVNAFHRLSSKSSTEEERTTACQELYKLMFGVSDQELQAFGTADSIPTVERAIMHEFTPSLQNELLYRAPRHEDARSWKPNLQYWSACGRSYSCEAYATKISRPTNLLKNGLNLPDAEAGKKQFYRKGVLSSSACETVGVG